MFPGVIIVAGILALAWFLLPRGASGSPIGPVGPIIPAPDPLKPAPAPGPFQPITPGPTPDPDPVGPFSPKPLPGDPIIVSPIPVDPDPDPLNPSPIPVPGKYYQVRSGDTGTGICLAAYGENPKPLKAWFGPAAQWTESGTGGLIRDPRNAWIHGADLSEPWHGGLYPKYSGHGTTWGSGTKHPVIYVPIVTSLGV